MIHIRNSDKKNNIPIRHFNDPLAAPFFAENFSIRNLSEIMKDKNMVQDFHRHDFFYLLALKTGLGTHNIDFIPYTVSDYSIFTMRPGQVHGLTLNSGSSGYLLQISKEFINLHADALKQLSTKVFRVNHHQLSHEEGTQVINILADINQEYSSKKAHFELVARANLSILFITLIRQHNTIQAQGHYTQERLEKFLELLENNICTHKQVSQYAVLLNISIYQLNAITKTTLGKTSSALINEQLILEAQRCLLATNNQINQIAYHLGYDDVSYFIRFFKKHTGYTPEIFRQNFS
jgi:AraC family transcriptional activator of pobA